MRLSKIIGILTIALGLSIGLSVSVFASVTGISLGQATSRTSALDGNGDIVYTYTPIDCVKAGDTFYVPVILAAADGDALAGASFDLEYDPAITLYNNGGANSASTDIFDSIIGTETGDTSIYYEMMSTTWADVPLNVENGSAVITYLRFTANATEDLNVGQTNKLFRSIRLRQAFKWNDDGDDLDTLLQNTDGTITNNTIINRNVEVSISIPKKVDPDTESNAAFAELAEYNNIKSVTVGLPAGTELAETEGGSAVASPISVTYYESDDAEDGYYIFTFDVRNVKGTFSSELELPVTVKAVNESGVSKDISLSPVTIKF